MKSAGSEPRIGEERRPRPKPTGAPMATPTGAPIAKPVGAPKAKPEGAPKGKPEGAPKAKSDEGRKSISEEAPKSNPEGRASRLKPGRASKSKPEEEAPKLVEEEVPKRKDKGAKSKTTPAEENTPAEEKTPETKTNSAPKEIRGIVVTDVLVVTVLWTSEIVYFTNTTLRDKFVDQGLTSSESRALEGETGITYGSIITLTLIFMMILGTLLMYALETTKLEIIDGYKFWILFGGLVFNVISAALGIALSSTRSKGIASLMTWLEIGWYSTHPIRFWYIFHQKFPISIRWSHLLVSVNLLVIGLVEYIFAVLVKETSHTFSQNFFFVAFSITAVAAVAWMIGTFFIKRYLNPVRGDLNSVREEYGQTEVIEHFDRRQKGKSIVMFLALMCPSVILPITSILIEIGQVKLMENALNTTSGLCSYRPDLALYLATIIIVEGLLQFLKKIRNELMDLILIAISHIIIIAAVILLMYILYLTRDYRRRYPDNGEAILAVFGNSEDDWVIKAGEESCKLHQEGSFTILKNFSDKVPIRIANPDTGEVVLEEFLDIQVSRNLSVNAYNLMKVNGVYRLLRIEQPPMVYTDTARYFLINGLEECTDYNKEFYDMYFDPSKTVAYRVNGRCLPLSLVVTDADKRDWKDPVKVPRFKPPRNNESFHTEIPCLPKDDPITKNGTLCHKLKAIGFVHLQEYVYKAHSKLKTRNNSFAIQPVPHQLLVVRLEEIERMIIPHGFLGICVGFRTIDDKLLVVTASLYGIGLGIGWVGYIHFLWIQAPVRFRIPIIFSFFGMIFTASSVTDRYYPKFNENVVFPVLIIATVCFLAHVAVSVLFLLKWMFSRKGETPQQSWRRY